MDNLFKLLFFLAIAIVVMVLVLERFGKPVDAEQQAKLSRWILPLCAILVIASMIKYYM